MIVVVGRVRTDADKRAELVRIGRAVAAASRDERGCIGYRLYEDTELDNDFVFVEEWESNEALQQHRDVSRRQFMRAIPATIVAPPDVKFHTIEKLYGSRGCEHTLAPLTQHLLPLSVCP